MAAMAMSTSSAGVSNNNARSGGLRQLRGISIIAAQKLLLDVTSLRGILIGFLSSVHAPTGTKFVKLVNRDIGRIKAIFNVILELLTASIATYVSLVADHGSSPDLQRKLDSRALIRADDAPLVLGYSRCIAPSQHLRAVKPHSHGRDDHSTLADSMGGGQTQKRSYSNNSNDGVGDT